MNSGHLASHVGKCSVEVEFPTQQWTLSAYLHYMRREQGWTSRLILLVLLKSKLFAAMVHYTICVHLELNLLMIIIYYYSFSVMMKCWALSPDDRPTFKELISDIDKDLQRAAGYLELNMVLLPPTNDEDTIDSDSD